MDDRRFDNLARLLAGAGWSRRGLARVLTGAVLTPVLGLGFAAETDARKKGKGKGKKKKKKNQPPPPPPGCNGDCTGKACLADDGCGAPCLSGSCPGTDVCTTGGCVSPGCGPGKRDCGGGVCIPDGDLSCCNQAEGRCGASSSANDLLCNPDTN
ncbi:MAG: hypothetical protein H0V00_14480, partial [Chloroflexia bacterium]|nr:hypothetical protein [Chloroflexia bacterium]